MRFTVISIAASMTMFLALTSPVAAATCPNGMVATPADVRTLNAQIPECVFQSDLDLFKREGFEAGGKALEYLKTKVCPGKQVGYNQSIPPSQLKEQYVYFSYPNGYGDSTMSASALVCFQKSIQDMEAAGLQPCIVAALRSPQHQDASCKDRGNKIVCGRTKDGGCSGSYGNCPHVRGGAMDFNDRTTCSPNGGCSISPSFANKMRQLTATAGARATVANDLPHLECSGAGGANIPDGGYVGPPSNGQGMPQSANPFQNMMSGIQNLMTPPQPQQCQPGYVLLNGQCLPQQAQAMNQTNPFGYVQPNGTSNTNPGGTPVSTTIGTGVGGTGSGTGGSGTTGVDIGKGINISDEIETKPIKGTASSAIDFINDLANPTSTSATSTEIGQGVALNGSLSKSVALKGVSASSTNALAPTSTYTLNPQAAQTFVSQDLSKTGMQYSLGSTNSTFTLLENIRQILISIIAMTRPFGGVVPTGTVRPGINATTAFLR